MTQLLILILGISLKQKKKNLKVKLVYFGSQCKGVACHDRGNLKELDMLCAIVKKTATDASAWHTFCFYSVQDPNPYNGATHN